MIEGRMNGVAEAHYGQSMYGSGYPMNPASYANLVKEAQVLYRSQLPQKIEVTNPPYHPYVAADHQTPINLVQKDMPPETNGYAAFSHRNVAAPTYSNLFPYHPSLMGGPYTPHQQVHHYTPHRPPYTTTTSAPIAIPISRPAPESSPVEVKTSQASMNGENHAFKKPDEGSNRFHHKYRPKKRQVHAPTPTPHPVPATSIAQFIPPPMNEQPPQPQMQQQSRTQLQPPTSHQTLNEDDTLHSIDRFGANHWVKFGGAEITNHLTSDEFVSLRKRGELVPMQEVTMEDWQRFAKHSDKDLTLITVKKISENHESGKVGYLLLHSSHREQREWGILEVEFERPMFVFGRGWTSYSPDRTRERCNGMLCAKINEGDVVLILTDKAAAKKTAEDSAIADQLQIKKARSHKRTDLNENRTSDLQEFTNIAAAAPRKLKRVVDEPRTVAHEHLPKKHWFQKTNDLSENHIIGESYHEFVNNTLAAANRSVPKRPVENDTNNNESASAAAKRKRSPDEANKRRWSDSAMPC